MSRSNIRNRARRYKDKAREQDNHKANPALRHQKRQDHGNEIVAHLATTLQLSEYIYDRLSHIRDSQGRNPHILQLLTAVSNMKIQLKKCHDGIQPIWDQARHSTVYNDKEWINLKGSLNKIKKTALKFEESLRILEKDLGDAS